MCACVRSNLCTCIVDVVPMLLFLAPKTLSMVHLIKLLVRERWRASNCTQANFGAKNGSCVIASVRVSKSKPYTHIHSDIDLTFGAKSSSAIKACPVVRFGAKTRLCVRELLFGHGSVHGERKTFAFFGAKNVPRTIVHTHRHTTYCATRYVSVTYCQPSPSGRTLELFKRVFEPRARLVQ